MNWLTGNTLEDMPEFKKIEILQRAEGRDAWWNAFIGDKFEAVVRDNYYELTKKSIMKLNVTGNSYVKAIITFDYAAEVGEAIKKFNIPKIPVVPRNIHFLQEVRVFRATATYGVENRRGEIVQTIFVEGDLFEEMWDKPNYIRKVGTNTTFKLKDINESTILLPKFEYVEEIDAKESQYFTTNKEKLFEGYKKDMNKLARLNEKLTMTRFMLDIDDEAIED